MAFSPLTALNWLLLSAMLIQGMNIPLAVAATSPRGAARTPVASGSKTTIRTATSTAQIVETVAVYGPQRFERRTGAPTTYTQQFSLPPNTKAPFLVQLQNGAADGSGRASSAGVKLNGQDLFLEKDFNKQVGSLTRNVTLAANNTLEVRLTSAPGSHITIAFTATRAQALPAALDSIEPGRATQGQNLTVMLRGRNTHWTAGQTRASFGSEVSVGGAAPGELGTVTVTDATTAVADVSVSPTAALAPRAARVVTGPGNADEESVSLANALTVVSVSAPGSSASNVSTLAGGAGAPGFADGAAGQARFNNLAGIAVGADDSIYVADAGNNRIRVVRAASSGSGLTVSTLAGNGAAGFADGPAQTAQFNNPQGLSVGAGGAVYVADTDNHRIRRIAPDGTVTTLAGDGTPGFTNGAGAQARFNAPRGVAADNFGNIYVADAGNSAVRVINGNGEVSTVAGDGTIGSTDSPNARFDGVSGIASDGEHVFIYLADTGNHRIRRLDATNSVVTLAGAERGFADGSASQARFAEPSGIAVDGDGKIVVADAINSLVRSVDPTLATSGSLQAVTTLAGTGERGATDGAGNVARFYTPRGIAVSPSSAVVVADTGNHTLRRILLPPAISGLSPERARPGDQITINGERFDARSPERNTVRFTRSAELGGGQTTAHVVSATRGALTVEVPADVAKGPVTVQTEGGTATSPEDFDLKPLSAPALTDFDPKRGPVGAQVALLGTGLKAGANDPSVSFAGSNNTRLPALVTSSTETDVRVLVPNGAVTGFIELTNAGGRASTPAPFTVESEQDFQITIAPSSATAVQRGTATYLVSVNSAQPSFSQLANLSAVGLPSGVKAIFEPEQITSGARSTLSLSLSDANLSPGAYSFVIKAVADADGRELSRSANASLSVLAAGQTTLSGRVLSTEGDPIMGAVVSLDGKTTNTDAAGAFILSGVTAGQARPLMIDGRTASAPNRTYPVILEPANIVAGQANIIPYIYYLPPIDTQYEVQVVPGQNTSAGNPRVPGLQMNIPAGANLRNRDGSPVARVSITPLAIDRTPTPLPSNVTTSIVYTSQPGGAITSVPVPVVYPNLAGADPGTRVELYAFDHDLVRWYIYGYGRVSADGRTISPETDPNTGRPYGLRDFSWHFPNAGPDGNPGGPGGCPESSGSNPVDYSTGIKLEKTTDISFGGARGGLELTRIHTSDLPQSCDSCPFGRGTTHNYAIRLTGSFQAGGAGRVVMPDEAVGRLFSYAGTNANGEQVFRTTSSVAQLGDEVHRLSNGTLEYVVRGGETMRFDGGGRLTSIVAANGNTIATLSYTGANLTRITDAVNRSINLEYDFAGRITRATDPLNRAWRYTYEGTPGVAGNPGLTTVTNPLDTVTRYSYVVGGRLASIADGRGNLVKQITYDGNGRVTQQKFADGGTERYSYSLSGTLVTEATVTDTLGKKVVKRFNASGYVIGTTDALGQTGTINRDITNNTATSTTGPCGCTEASQKYDARGNVIEITDRQGQTTRMEYEPLHNRLVKRTDHLGRSTSFSYDARGNVLTVSNSLNQATTFAYTADGLLAGATDPLGHTVSMEYDQYGNVQAAIDPLGHRTTMEYDAVGRLLATTDALGRRTALTYDALDHVTAITDPTGATTKMTYDLNGNITKVVNALGQQTTRSFDGKNRLISTTDHAGRTSKAQYNTNNKVIGMTAPSGKVVRYTYDERGQVTNVANSSGGAVRFKYDSRGNLVSVTDQRGSLTTFVYDEQSRPVEMRDPLGRSSRVGYDASGNVIEKIDRLGRRTTYTYDVLDRLSRVNFPDASVNYTYDASSKLTRVDDSQSGSVEWDFDEAGRMLSETTPNGVVRYTYNDAGQVLSMTAGNRTPVLYGYDTVGRLKDIKQGTETFTYLYDELSRVSGLQRPNGVQTSYGFDTLGRVDKISHANGLNQLIEEYRYTYGNNNEITAITSLGSAPLFPSAKTAGAADASNRVTSLGQTTYALDDEGKTISKTDAQGTTNYSWDSRGRMTKAALPDGRAVSYNYDAMGRMASRTMGGASTSYLYNGPHVVQDKQSNGAEVNYLNGVGIDDTLRQSSDATGSLYFLRDHLGSTIGLTDAAGNVAERMSYEPYGESPGSSLTRYGFTGRERDSATGLLYMRARWYDPQMGRFISQDPIGMRGGLNVYAYALNNPLSLIDPFGLSFSSFMSGFARGFVVGGITGALIAAAIAATGGVAGAIIAVVALGYGAYQLMAAIEELMNGDLCPDERDELLGELIGGAIGAALGGGVGGRLGGRLGGPRGGGPRGGGPNGGGPPAPPGPNPGEVPTDLSAFGNKNAPRAPRAGKDVFPDADGNVGPEAPPLPKGASTFSDPNQAPLTGHHHTLPAGTQLPEGLGVVADGNGVVPNSPHPAGHHTIYPTVSMPYDSFVNLFNGLPWQYGGKK
jgi:RHS repeat-associated protein